MTPVFVNPYRMIGLEVPFKVGLFVEKEHINTIRTVLPEHGALATIVGLAIYQTYDHVKVNGLTLADREKLIKYILRQDHG